MPDRRVSSSSRAPVYVLAHRITCNDLQLADKLEADDEIVCKIKKVSRAGFSILFSFSPSQEFASTGQYSTTDRSKAVIAIDPNANDFKKIVISALDTLLEKKVRESSVMRRSFAKKLDNSAPESDEIVFYKNVSTPHIYFSNEDIRMAHVSKAYNRDPLLRKDIEEILGKHNIILEPTGPGEKPSLTRDQYGTFTILVDPLDKDALRKAVHSIQSVLKTPSQPSPAKGNRVSLFPEAHGISNSVTGPSEATSWQRPKFPKAKSNLYQKYSDIAPSPLPTNTGSTSSGSSTPPGSSSSIRSDDTPSTPPTTPPLSSSSTSDIPPFFNQMPRTSLRNTQDTPSDTASFTSEDQISFLELPPLDTRAQSRSNGLDKLSASLSQASQTVSQWVQRVQKSYAYLKAQEAARQAQLRQIQAKASTPLPPIPQPQVQPPIPPPVQPQLQPPHLPAPQTRAYPNIVRNQPSPLPHRQVQPLADSACHRPQAVRYTTPRFTRSRVAPQRLPIPRSNNEERRMAQKFVPKYPMRAQSQQNTQKHVLPTQSAKPQMQEPLARLLRQVPLPQEQSDSRRYVFGAYDFVQEKTYVLDFLVPQRILRDSFSEAEKEEQSFLLHHLHETGEYPPPKLPSASSMSVEELLTPTKSYPADPSGFVRFGNLFVKSELVQDFIRSHRELAKEDPEFVCRALEALQRGGPQGQLTFLCDGEKLGVSLGSKPGEAHVITWPPKREGRSIGRHAVDLISVEGRVNTRIYDRVGELVRAGTPYGEGNYNDHAMKAFYEDRFAQTLGLPPQWENIFHLLLPTQSSNERSLRVRGKDGTFFAPDKHETVGYAAPLTDESSVCSVDTNDARSVSYDLKTLSYAICNSSSEESVALTRELLQDAARHGDIVRIRVNERGIASYRNPAQEHRLAQDQAPGSLGRRARGHRSRLGVCGVAR